VTYYWTASPTDPDVDLSTPAVDILDEDDQVITTEPESYAQKLALEGSGFLSDGRLINLACSCPYPNARFFLVDTTSFPWGMDAQGNGLLPFDTIAVDPEVIPLGTEVYSATFDGLELPDGSIHDGIFHATDTSHSFSGPQIDIFTATYSNYESIDAQLDGLEELQIELIQ
jgi:3D (Asp-Asp-Asp) domain-containing protein